MKRLGPWLLARWPWMFASVAAGAMFCASFAPLNWWWAAILAFVVLAVVLHREQTTRWGGFGYGFMAGMAFYLPLLPWVGGLVGPMPWVMLAVMSATFVGLFGASAVTVRVLPGWPVWFALVWAGTELLKTVIPFGGFPWGVIGFGQTTGPLLPLAQLGGVPLISTAAALLGFGLAGIGLGAVQWWNSPEHRAHQAEHHRSQNPRGHTAGLSLAEHHRSQNPPKVVLAGICCVVVLLAVALTYPHVRQAGVGTGDEPVVNAAVVQGNVPRLGLEFNAQRRQVLDNHVKETLRLAEDVQAGRAAQPQLVIWPENSSDIDPLANADARGQISQAAKAIGVPILVGAVVAAPDATADNPAAFNTAIVWDPAQGPGERHDKQIVQPFGEYLPWRSFFRRLSSYADRAGYFIPGSGTGVVQMGTETDKIPVGVATCWEVIFDRAPRESVRNGAQVLAVPTNNATFDAMMSEQQLAIARVRAVEHDRYVLVAGTTGISAIIAPDGREVARTNFFESSYLDAPIRLKTTVTSATRWGPAIQYALVGAGLAAILAAAVLTIRQNGGLMRGTRRRRHQPTPDTSDHTPDLEESHDQ